MGKKSSSRRWLQEHESDPFVQEARKKGYRSRAYFKLHQLDRRDRLLRAGMTVVDLGAAPGGWSQYAAERVAGKGRIYALDLLAMAPLPGVTCIQGDFREREALSALEHSLDGAQVDLVLSDMAPNISGIGVADQARAIDLAELAALFANDHLAAGGSLVVKVFQGQGFDAFLTCTRTAFERVAVRKPEASRDRSRELYLVARGYRL